MVNMVGTPSRETQNIQTGIRKGTRPDFRALAALARRQYGFFTASQAMECGVGWALCSYHAKTGAFIRVRRALYRIDDVPSTRTGDIFGAWLYLASKEPVVSHDTALELHGLIDNPDKTIHLTVRRHVRRIAPRGINLHTSVRFPAGQDVVSLQGMKVTGPARSLTDAAAADLPPDVLQSAVRRAIQRGLTNRTELLFVANESTARVRRLMRRAVH